MSVLKLHEQNVRAHHILEIDPPSLGGRGGGEVAAASLDIFRLGEIRTGSIFAPGLAKQTEISQVLGFRSSW